MRALAFYVHASELCINAMIKIKKNFIQKWFNSLIGSIQRSLHLDKCLICIIANFETNNRRIYIY